MTSETSTMSTPSFSPKIKIAFLLSLLLSVVIASFFLPIGDWLKLGLDQINRLGFLGIILFALTYALATVLMIPGTFLTLGAGFIYGPFLGTLIVSPASVLGASLAFLLGRYVFRNSITQKMKRYPNFLAVDRAIGHEGTKIVFLLRLSPIFPFNLLNYLLGLSSVSFPNYLWASFFGMLPGTFLYVYFGSIASSLTELSSGVAGEKNLGSTILYWGGLAATLVVTLMITRIAKKALGNALVEKKENNFRVSSEQKDTNLQVLPHDTYNKELLDNVHPSDYTNPNPQRVYNLVVVGAGTAGLISSSAAAGLGAKVALIERQFMGGDCLNFGCVPSKAILKPAHFLQDLKRARSLGIAGDGLPFDFSQMMQEMRKIRAQISNHDSVKRYQSLGVDVFLGHARFLSPNKIKIGEHVLKFKRAIIATGGRARELNIEGANKVPLLNNENIFMLTELPRKLLVVGGGPIGCEIAQAFRAFGSEVTLVEIQDRILPNDDQEAARLVLDQMTSQGIQFEFLTKPLKIEDQGGQKILTAEQGKNTVHFDADEIFCALGRTPNIEGLDLEAANVQYESHGVVVNDYLQTSNPNIYAAGDICSRFQFTHAADAMARIAIQNALFFGRKKASSLNIPWCTYTDLELGHVGMQFDEAKAQGFDVATITVPMESIDRAILDRETKGFVRVHYDKKNKGQILGATAVCKHAGEIMGLLSVALTNKISLSEISQTIFPYPTQTEVFKRIADAYSRTRLTAGASRMLKRFMSWRRL